uniref:Ig-like domain-containing protein n=1 Tax=Monodelphis domestica TaxID=13616 RepID=A0A5F8GNJ8_MONDO
MEKSLGASFLIFCLHLGWVSCQQKVEQSPPTQIVQEGENTTFSCHYSDSTSTRLQWFRQDTGKGLILLFNIVSEGKQKGRLRSTINKKELLSSLYITDSQPEDSSTYLCAVEPQ